MQNALKPDEKVDLECKMSSHPQVRQHVPLYQVRSLKQEGDFMLRVLISRVGYNIPNSDSPGIVNCQTVRTSLPSLTTIEFQKQKKKTIWFKARNIHRGRYSRQRVDQPGHRDIRHEQPRYQPAVPASPGHV